MLFAELRGFRTCHSKRRLLAAAFSPTLSVLDVDHPIRGVLRTVLHRFRTCHSEMCNLTAACGSALVTPDADHPVRCVLCAELRGFRTCHSKRRLLAAASGSALSIKDVEYPIRGMLRTVLRRFRTCHSKRRPLFATFGSALFRCVLCAAVHSFLNFNSKRRNFATFSFSLCAAAGEVERPVLHVLPAGQTCSTVPPASS